MSIGLQGCLSILIALFQECIFDKELLRNVLNENKKKCCEGINYLPLRAATFKKWDTHMLTFHKLQYWGVKRMQVFQRKTQWGQQFFPTGRFSTSERTKQHRPTEKYQKNCYVGLLIAHIVSKCCCASTFGRMYAEILSSIWSFSTNKRPTKGIVEIFQSKSKNFWHTKNIC